MRSCAACAIDIRSSQHSLSFLRSELFEVSGPGKTTFKVHGERLAQKSKVLAKAAYGTMQESKTKSINIEAVNNDINDDTVMRFLEYIYTNDYPVPDHVVSESSSGLKTIAEAFLSSNDPEPEMTTPKFANETELVTEYYLDERPKPRQVLKELKSKKWISARAKL